MIGKYKVVHLAGKTRGHEKEFREVEKKLTEKGYIVFAPVFYSMDEYLAFGDCPNMLDDMCFEKLLQCDMLVIVTPDKIGISTRKRISQAVCYGKEVFAWNGWEITPLATDRMKTVLWEVKEYFRKYLPTHSVEEVIQKDRYSYIVIARKGQEYIIYYNWDALNHDLDRCDYKYHIYSKADCERLIERRLTKIEMNSF